jgi:hypothetical protein
MIDSMIDSCTVEHDLHTHSDGGSSLILLQRRPNVMRPYYTADISST